MLTANTTNCPISQNDPPPGNTQTSLPNEYVHYVAPQPNAVTVIGFALYTGSVSGSPATVQAGVYVDAGGVPAANATVNGTLRSDGPIDWYHAFLDEPVTIPANTPSWVSADANAIYPPAATSGTSPAVASHWRRPPFGGGAWSPTGIVSFPAFRIHCAGNVNLPVLSSAGVPTIGQNFTVDLGNATPGTTAWLAIGFSDTVSLGLPLPLDLSKIGATCCPVYTSCGHAISARVGAAGTTSVSVGVPNDPGLAGLRFYNQWVIIDPGSNPLGVVTSNKGTGVIG